MEEQKQYYGQGYFVVAMQVVGCSPEQIRIAEESICCPLGKGGRCSHENTVDEMENVIGSTSQPYSV